MAKSRKVLVTSALLLFAAISSVSASADDYDHRGPPGDGYHDHDGRGWRGGDYGPAGPHGGPHRHGPGPDKRDSFAWQGHHFERGGYVPHDFRGPDYRVDDWQRRGLPEPPHGHRWSYIDGNYVLVAVATGVITSIILNNAFHP